MVKKLGIALAVLIIITGIVSYFRSSPLTFAHDAVGVVEITGGIYDPTDTLQDLRQFAEESRIRGVIVRIDSPGGTVAASQELYQAIHELAAKKPVVASMGNVAASGGYYAACGAGTIIANPGTITGSIGVRVEHVEVGDLLQWAKIHYETIKSGEFKDLLSVNRPLSPEERRLVEELLGDIHGQFKKTVAESRKLDPAKVASFADGRILSGSQAHALGLVDELGGFSTAVRKMQALLGIKEEPTLIYAREHAPWWVRWVTGKNRVGVKLEMPGLRVLYEM